MKHTTAIKLAWKDESAHRKRRRDRLEREFLPAALEIMDTPPRPLGRAILWVIVLASGAAITWAALSQVDIVAVSEGRVIPRGRLQSVETAETGIVRALNVREGDRVTQGMVLVELDPTDADADADASRKELATARLQRARARTLLQYSAGDTWKIDAEGLAPGVTDAETSLVSARIRAHEAEFASLQEKLNGAEAARRQAETEVRRIDETLPIINQQLASRRELAANGYAPMVQVQELEEKATALRFERSVQIDEIAKAENQSEMIRRDVAAHAQTFRAEAAAELSEAESVLATRGDLLAKAEKRESLQRMTAPVTGTVQEISITTIGEVVEPGQPIVTIVPEGAELIVEAFLLNRDAGFVKINQDAIIKLEAYPFMRYGYLEGEVEHVSPDAIVDEQRGLVFPVRVKITRARLRGDGALASLNADSDDYHALLSPGLSAAVEIKTGTRSVLSYLLSPVTRSVQEAGRER